MSTNLEKLTNATKLDVELHDGATCTVKEVTIGLLPAFSRLVKPILAKGLVLDNVNDVKPAEIVNMFIDELEPLIEFISLISGIESDDLNARPLDDLVNIVGAVIEVNVDFFIERVLPSLETRSTRLEKTFGQIDKSKPGKKETGQQ